MSEELSWELYDLFDSERYAFPIYDHASARRIVRYLLYRGILDEEIADAIEDSTADLRVWLNRAGKAMVGEWVIAWVNEVNDEYRLDKQRRGSVLLDHHDPSELESPVLCTIEADNDIFNYRSVTVVTESDVALARRTSPLTEPNSLNKGASERRKTIARKYSATPLVTIPHVSSSKSATTKTHTSRKNTLVCDFQAKVIDIQPSKAASNDFQDRTDEFDEFKNKSAALSLVISSSALPESALPYISVSVDRVNENNTLVCESQVDASQPANNIIPTDPCKALANVVADETISDLLLHSPDDTETSVNNSVVSSQTANKSLSALAETTRGQGENLMCTCSISHFIYPSERGAGVSEERESMDETKTKLNCCCWCKSHRLFTRSKRTRSERTLMDRPRWPKDNSRASTDSNSNNNVVNSKRPRRYRPRTIIEDEDGESAIGNALVKIVKTNADGPGFVIVLSDPVQCSIAGQEVFKIAASANPRSCLSDFKQRHSSGFVIWQVRVSRAVSALNRIRLLLQHCSTGASSSWFTCSLEVIIDAVSSVVAADRELRFV